MLHRWKALLLIPALVVFFSACSSNEEKDVETIVAPLVDFESLVTHKRVWKVSTGSGWGRKYLRLVPAISDSKIFVANASGDVYAFDLEKGKKLWKTKTQYEISGGVNATAGKVVVGTLDGEVITFDAETGEVLWEAKTSSEILGEPATDGNVTVVQTIDARVFAFDAKTGAPKWSYDHIVPVLSLRGSSGPVITASGVICAFDNGQILSFAKDSGSRQWDFRISQPKGKTDLERIVDIDGTPVEQSGLLYAGSYQGNIAALSRAQGKPIWRKAASTFNRLAVGYGRVVATVERSRVAAFNSANGDKVWENEQLLNRELSAPALIDDYVAVIDHDDLLHLLSKDDGSFVHRFKVSGDGFHSPMLSHNGKLYILSDDGELSAYEFKAKEQK